jgi:hypothetical protein
MGQIPGGPTFTATIAADLDHILAVQQPRIAEAKAEPGPWWERFLRTTTDVLGTVPIFGEVADGANAAWYTLEGALQRRRAVRRGDGPHRRMDFHRRQVDQRLLTAQERPQSQRFITPALDLAETREADDEIAAWPRWAGRTRAHDQGWSWGRVLRSCGEVGAAQRRFATPSFTFTSAART